MFKVRKNKYSVEERRTYLIIPMSYDVKGGVSKLSLSKTYGYEEFTETSDDFLKQLNDELASGKLIKAYQKKYAEPKNEQDDDDKNKQKFTIPKSMLFFFDGGIAFKVVCCKYQEADTLSFYKFLLPGYIDDTSGDNNIKSHLEFLSEDIIDDVILNPTYNLQFFDYPNEIVDPNQQSATKRSVKGAPFVYKGDLAQAAYDEAKKIAEYIVKDAYKCNTVFVDQRFDSTDELKDITYKTHKIMELNDQYDDDSESDIRFTSGPKDVIDKKYRWGCCITSQDISYIYGRSRNNEPHEQKSMDANAENDILLTMLVLYQRYRCLKMEKEILDANDKENNGRKKIMALKNEAISLITYQTKDISQISRWNNVCDTYGYLMEVTGTSRSIDCVRDKVEILDAKIENNRSKKIEFISFVITILGISSIIGEIFTISQAVMAGEFGIPAISSAIAIFVMVAAFIICYRK